MLIIKSEKIKDFTINLKKEFDFFDCSPSIGVLPFKRYFFPPKEEILSIEKEKNYINIPKSPKKFVVFGLNLPDLEALTQLDEIMKKPVKDFFYFQRRTQSVVIGIIKEKIDVAPGGDIVFQDIEEGKYRVWTNTKKGKNLIDNNKEFFKETEEIKIDTPQIPQDKHLREWQKSMRKILLDPELLADAVEWSRNHEIWDELKEKCLGCGICTYACPLCYCFSIKDSISLDGKCKRCRNWDACTLPGFARIAGGHNFRPTLKERYYNWFYHKFVRAYREYGKSQCVGCSRCKDLCPAEIDIYEVLKTVVENYKKELELAPPPHG